MSKKTKVVENDNIRPEKEDVEKVMEDIEEAEMPFPIPNSMKEENCSSKKLLEFFHFLLAVLPDDRKITITIDRS